eukprot:3159670-Amphidinium_carterae.1
MCMEASVRQLKFATVAGAKSASGVFCCASRRRCARGVQRHCSSGPHLRSPRTTHNMPLGYGLVLRAELHHASIQRLGIIF